MIFFTLMWLPVWSKEISARNGESRERGGEGVERGGGRKGGKRKREGEGAGEGRGKTCNDDSQLCLKEYE